MKETVNKDLVQHHLNQLLGNGLQLHPPPQQLLPAVQCNPADEFHRQNPGRAVVPIDRGNRYLGLSLLRLLAGNTLGIAALLGIIQLGQQ
ncbi:hypothetical protein D3C87_1965440 [compost metagenome]